MKCDDLSGGNSSVKSTIFWQTFMAAVLFSDAMIRIIVTPLNDIQLPILVISSSFIGM